MFFQGSEMEVVDQLKLFGTPDTESSIVSNEFVEFRPLHFINNTRPIDFRIMGKENQYIDLHRSLLKVQFKLLVEDGTDPAIAAKACVINNMAHSLWKQDDIYLNQVLVSPSSNHYMYKAYIDMTLKENARNNHEIEAAMYFADTSSGIDITNPTIVNNKGLVNRYAFVKEGQLATALSPLKSDLASLKKWILPGVEIHIRLWQTSDAFRIVRDNTEIVNYKIQLEDVVFLANIITVKSSVTLAHHQLLQTHNAKYPFERSRVQAFNIPTGSTSFRKDQLFQDERPDRVILGIVPADAYNGSLTANPYHFSPFGNPSEIDLTIDDQSMNGRPYIFSGWNDTTTPSGLNNFAEAFYQMQSFMQQDDLKKNGNTIQWINTAENRYRTGYTFFVFQEYAGLKLPKGTTTDIRKANTKLIIKFPAATSEDYALLVYGTFNDIFEIDKNKKIYLSR